MSTETRLAKQVRKNLAAIDVDKHRAELAEHEAEEARIERAIEDARERIAVIRGLLSTSTQRDANELARKLLNGEHPADAFATLPSRSELEQEIPQLNEAIRSLAGVRQRRRGERDLARRQLESEVRTAFEPLVEHYRTEAREAAYRLEECYAALNAFGSSTRGQDLMEDPLRNAVIAARDESGPIKRDHQPPVPSAMQDAMEAVEQAGIPLKIRRRDTVGV